jgi:hypothetical protein
LDELNNFGKKESHVANGTEMNPSESRGLEELWEVLSLLLLLHHHSQKNVL